MDAKYGELWDKSLPRYMLYQLAIYATNGIGDKTATILYPSLNDVATVQMIDINDPISSSKIASVILKPINLVKVTEMINDDKVLSKFVNELLK